MKNRPTISRSLPTRRLAREAAKRTLWMTGFQAEVLTDLLCEIIVEGLLRDGRVNLAGFGVFSLTLASVPANDRRWRLRVLFRPACALRAAVNSGIDPNRGCSRCRRKKKFQVLPRGGNDTA